MRSYDDIKKNGYSVFSGLISESVITTARNVINNDLKQHYDLQRIDEYNSRSFCPTIKASKEITALFEPIKSIIDDVLGENTWSIGASQIALRSPQEDVPDIIPHIDGIPERFNGVQGQDIEPFTLLIGIFFNDLSKENMGNLVVFPTSHKKIASYFKSQGSQALKKGMPDINFGEPKQLLCRAGDVIICDYHLVHAVAPNLSKDTRYAVYFRVSLHDVLKDRWNSLSNLWLDWKI